MSNTTITSAAAGELYARHNMPTIRVHRVMPDGTCSCRRANCWQGDKPSAGKHPDMGTAWQSKAVTDSATAAALFAPPYHEHNVGVVCSHASGLVMLDVDSDYGKELLAKLSGGDLPPTPRFKTGRGERLIYRNTSGVRLAERSEKNVDEHGVELATEAFGVLVGDGVQTVMPPSRHYSGRRYEWVPGESLEDLPIAPAPAWLIEYAADEKQVEATDAPTGDTDGPMGDFNRRKDWRELYEAAGWTLCHERGDGVQHLTRAGKGGGTSATLGRCKAKDGTPALYNFSGSVTYLAAKKAVDKFGFLARWKYRGDFTACALALRSGEFDGVRYGKQDPQVSFGQNGQHTGGTKANGKQQQNGKPEPEVELVVTTAADVQELPLEWLWPHRFPLGMMSNLVARPKQGKSVLTCDMAARITRGAMWPDGSGLAPRGDVVFMAAEDDIPRTTKPRLMAADADLTRVHFIEGVKAVSADGDPYVALVDLSYISKIRKVLKAKPNTKLLVIDPAGSYIGGGVDSYRDNEVRGVLTPLGLMAQELNIAVILVCHTSKAAVTFADDAILGSRGFGGIVRANWHLNPDPERKGRTILAAGGCNLSLSTSALAFGIKSCEHVIGQPAVIEWEPEPLEGVTADDFVGAPSSSGRPGPDPSEVERAAEWLRDLLEGEPNGVESKVVSSGAENMFTDATLRRAKVAVGVVAKRQAGGPNDAKRRKWYCGIGNDWTPPELEPEGEPEIVSTVDEATSTPIHPQNLSIYGDETPQVVDGQELLIDAQVGVQLEHLKGSAADLSTYGDGKSIGAQLDAQPPIDAQVKPPSEHLVKPKQKRAKRAARSIGAQVPGIRGGDPDPLTDATAFEALLRRSGWGVPEAIGYLNGLDEFITGNDIASLTRPQKERLVARLNEVVSQKGGAR